MQTIEDYIEREYRDFPASKLTDFMVRDFAIFLNVYHKLEFDELMESEVIVSAQYDHSESLIIGNETLIKNNLLALDRAIKYVFKMELEHCINDYDEQEEKRIEGMSFDKQRLL